MRANERHRGGRALLALATLMVLLVTAACGGGSSDGGAAASGSDDGESSSANVDHAGVLKVGTDLVQSPAGGFFLDPAKVPINNNDAIQYLIFGRLLRPLQDGSLVPDLAESATIVDPNTIEIKLRAGETFHDGTPFDAAAVKAGLDRSVASNNRRGLGDKFFSLTSVEATGTDTVTLKFADGSAPSWYSLLGSFETTIVKPDTDFEGLAVGAGPMKVTGNRPGDSLTLAKFDDHWMADQVLLGGMELVHIDSSQAQSATAALKAGQVDVVLSDPSQLSALTGNYELYTREDEAANVRMNVCKKEGPLANPLVRKAVNKAIDREAVSAAAYDGTAQPSVQMFPESNRFWNDEVGDDLAYDPEGAKQLLEEAGYPDGFTFDLYAAPILGLSEVAQVVEQLLADVGITANLKITSNYVEEFTSANVPGAGLAPGGVGGREKLANYTGDNLSNICDYADPKLSALITKLGSVSDASDEAKVIWDEITDIVYGDALSVWIVFRSQLAAYNSDVVGGLEMWPRSSSQIPLVYGTYVKK